MRPYNGWQILHPSIWPCHYGSLTIWDCLIWHLIQATHWEALRGPTSQLLTVLYGSLLAACLLRLLFTSVRCPSLTWSHATEMATNFWLNMQDIGWLLYQSQGSSRSKHIPQVFSSTPYHIRRQAPNQRLFQIWNEECCHPTLGGEVLWPGFHPGLSEIFMTILYVPLHYPSTWT